MKKQEKELFMSLCDFQAKEMDRALLRYASPTVLGALFFNRMQGVAYGSLKERELLGQVTREFRNSLKYAYDQNLVRNSSYRWSVCHLKDVLGGCSCRYAMLKGAMLCQMYPQGYRTSNDIDLLVNAENIGEIGEALYTAGFRQGNIRGGEFIPATRREIIESKMTRGETVPYIKEIDFPAMKYLEVDINFSLDYKADDGKLTEQLLQKECEREAWGTKIHTLTENDFFIHLCGHLYKEATTMPWVVMGRDMTLYKYADIYMLLAEMDKDQTYDMYIRAVELGLEKICAFAVLQTSMLFEVRNAYAISAALEIMECDPDFLHRVVAPAEKKTYLYTEKDIEKRFFCENRAKMMKEADLN